MPNSMPTPTIRQTQLFIDGQWISAQSGKTFDTVNPANEEVITQVAEGDATSLGDTSTLLDPSVVDEIIEGALVPVKQ